VEGYWTERPVLALNRDLELTLHVRSLATLPLLLLLTPWAQPAIGPDRAPRSLAMGQPERVRINDNRRSAGILRQGVLTIQLEARLARWYPDGDRAPGAEVPAFAAAGQPAEIPGPLIRVPAGTEIAITVRNALPNAVLTLHGLHARPRMAAAADTLHVAPRATRAVRFRLAAPGTYYYWGTTMGRVFLGRTREDAQLSGAIIVDPPERPVPEDRVLMIGMWADTLNSEDAPGPIPSACRMRWATRYAGVSSMYRRTCIPCTCTASSSGSTAEATGPAIPPTRRRRATSSSRSG
jgi:FtsP/CotA-like multicopper oxidase with cupredoxin domain